MASNVEDNQKDEIPREENSGYCWDEFRDWCEDAGVDLEYQEDWEVWWDCWKSAIDAMNSG